ncbi:MAG: YciI family protein [Betaproteobacteria bacterium]
MSYMLLMMETTDQRRGRNTAEGEEVYGRMVKFGESLKARGLLMGMESLKSLDTAARVQVRNQKSFVSDGPFAEAKEMIGGFFQVSCKTREEAVAIAAECPAAEWCTVEVRETGPCFA